MIEEARNLHPFHQWLDSEPWKKSKSIGLTGLKGSSKAYLLSLWRERIRKPLLIIVPLPRDAEILLEDLRFFQNETDDSLYLFPPWETLPYDDIPPHPEIIRERVKALFSLLRDEAGMIIAPIRALMQKVLPPQDLSESTLSLAVGEEVERDQWVQFLQKGGYTSVRIVEEPGDFSLRGAIVDVYSPLYEDPLRFEFDGDRLESIRRFEPESQRSLSQGSMEKVVLLPAKDLSKDSDRPLVTLFEYLRDKGKVFIAEGEAVEKEANSFTQFIEEHHQKALMKKRSVPPPESAYLRMDHLTSSLNRFQTVFLQDGPVAPPQCQHLFPFEMETNEALQMEMKAGLSGGAEHHERTPFSLLLNHLREWQRKRMKVFIVSHTQAQAERLRELFLHYEVESHLEMTRRFREVVDQPERDLTLLIGPLSSGFRNPQEGWGLLTEEEIFGERRRVGERKARKGPPLLSFSELKEDAPIVHVDFGIALYRGLRHLKIGGVSNDYLLLEYQDGDKLYVPVDRLNLIQRYIGGDGRPRLDRLGGSSWQRAMKRVKAAIAEMVKEILDLYAARQVFQGHRFSSLDQFYREFEAAFEYEETPDQAKAIEEVMGDMGNPKPMDRLVCGDVGYGKTEVAVRAAYRAVMDGKQVALLVPTTVLAQQHYQTFKDRFKAYPVMIDVLSRFKSPREQKAIVQRLEEGKVDIVIGTHRLLQKDVVFRDLGLVVIDEEHRFGVNHKERLKQLRRLVDVITLTATPIPRTLQMATSGIRDLSLIQTPPENRLAIRTLVVRYDDDVIREAIRREFNRGGQVFFVHHRVQNIHSIAHHLKRLIPEASLAIAHGQMKEKELERVMLQFVRREYNLLVCTSIIESGLDIPAANTILINHAEQFGLADLYQLRGRVGRGSHQAYAYLLIPGELTLSRDAMRRLRAIQELSELGSGFKLALQDLEIRGAGNLLGPTQSGHISAVGFELYTQFMEKAVRELKGETVVEEITPEIHFHLPAFIPEFYVEDPEERLRLYRRLSLSRSDEEVEGLGEELVDRFGKVPEEVNHLLEVIKVKILLTKLAIKKFEETRTQIVLTFDETTRVSPQKVIELIRHGAGRYRLTPDSKLVVEGGPDQRRDPFEASKKLLQALA
ncbi:MAG: transcription-repair coupling factor [Deltaproteobacteria bacterium RBG_16_50_11]|nr:MAG: transcription-repair coupling factor [Deltaproteobacteria bacterium RBG_16_50_11]